MMLTYKGKELVKIENKQGGKNHNEVNGFYQNSGGEEFFIKKPADSKELFAELFVGLLLDEFKSEGLIEPIYQPSLICGDAIRFQDGSYGIIQPRIRFTELYKLIGTGYWNGSDRAPLTEMFFGPRYYPLLTQRGHYFGLALALMFSLLMGDYSVHSANMVCLQQLSTTESAFTQFARLDWGAALRYFGHESNNQNLLFPFEYHGWLNLKCYTKGYFLNYKKISGLFPAIANEAKGLMAKLNEMQLIEIVENVLKKIPGDLLNEKDIADISQYICMESFKEINFLEGEYELFATKFVDLLVKRLKMISELQEFASLEGIKFSEHTPIPMVLRVNSTVPFPEQMRVWLSLLTLSDSRASFDFSTIDLPLLADQYNNFIDFLLDEFEGINLGKQEEIQLSNTEILRYLFTVKRNMSPAVIPYKEPVKKHLHEDKNQCLKAIYDVLTTGFHAIVTAKILVETQNSSQCEEGKAHAIHLLFNGLREHLNNFQNSLEACLTLLNEENANELLQTNDLNNKQEKSSLIKRLI